MFKNIYVYMYIPHAAERPWCKTIYLLSTRYLIIFTVKLVVNRAIIFRLKTFL